MMYIVFVWIVVSSCLFITVEAETWMKGCYTSTDLNNMTASDVQASTIAECAQICDTTRYSHAAVGKINGIKLECRCINITAEQTQFLQDSTSCWIENGLLLGNGENCWSLYTSEGPYLTSVTMTTDSNFVVVNKPVAIEISVTRNSAVNVTEEELDLAHWLEVRWMVARDNTSYHDSLHMEQFTEIFLRPRYTFNDVGLYTIYAEVSNGISVLHTSLHLEVVYPKPLDLQLGLPDKGQGHDLPSCLPENLPSNVTESDQGTNVKVTPTKEGQGQTFAVFVNSTVQLEASVGRGDNLTFIFTFEDDDDVTVLVPCGKCLSVIQEHVFQEIGTFTVMVAVNNSFGSLQHIVTMVVIERVLSNLTINLVEGSSHLATVGQPIQFVVSMVTTSREDRFLQVWYGDGHDNIVSLTDINAPKLVLAGTGKEMDIVASYGIGCTLTVEFQYVYNIEGSFKPKVEVFEQDEDTISPTESDTTPTEEPDVTNDVSQYLDLNIFSLGFNEDILVMENKTDDTKETKNEDKSNKEHGYAELPETILALSEIKGLKMYSPKIGRCNEEIVFRLQIPSKVNVSFLWAVYRIMDDDLDLDSELDDVRWESKIGGEYDMVINEGNANLDLVGSYVEGSSTRQGLDGGWVSDDLILVEDVFTTNDELGYVFEQSGDYLVVVKAQNAISEVESSANFMIQCPVHGLEAKCMEYVIRTDSEVICEAYILEGTDAIFNWSIEDRQVAVDTDKNNNSILRYRLTDPLDYAIMVTAQNNVSKEYFYISPTILVQDPVKNIKVFITNSNILLGEETVFYLIYPYPRRDMSVYLLYPLSEQLVFDFDFGNGRVSKWPICDDKNAWCYAQYVYEFDTIGKHKFDMYVYNNVSEMSKTVDVSVYNDLYNVTMEIVNTPVAGKPTRFLVLENGNAMVTRDVYFTWKFVEDATEYTNSPVAQTIFEYSGNFTVYVKATNPVVDRLLEIPVYVWSRSEFDLYLHHDLYVVPGEEVAFDLELGSEDPPVNGSSIQVHYSDGDWQHVDSSQFNVSWTHAFLEPGLHHLTVTVVDEQGTNLKEMTSYIMIEEPITGLELSGPEALVYSKFEKQAWEATLFSGTSVMFHWSFNNATQLLAPTTWYDIDVPTPGIYELTVEAFNDVTTVPVFTSLVVFIGDDIDDLQMNVKGNLVGMETDLGIMVSSHDPSFYIDIDYGDGYTSSLYSLDPAVMVTNLSNDLHFVSLGHTFQEVGEFNITVNASNSVNSFVTWEVFNPIGGVTLKSRSPRIIRSPGYAVVMVTVQGGSDLNYIWNFSDDFEETLVKRYPNQTSLAKHPYGMSGEYGVSLNITGAHYPPPGIHAKLPTSFLVVDTIDMVKLYANQNSSALEGNMSSPVKFIARSSGSRVRFIFDFGDGSQEEVNGTELSHMNVDMTMSAEVMHTYNAVGEYRVKVIAVNPLGNKTVYLSRSFWVQRAPVDLHFCNGSGNRFSKKIGETIILCAGVSAGTNVTFDWKLGDQTDIVKAGPTVPHEYKSPGIKTVYVTARNKVNKLTLSARVYVNYDIQGVNIKVTRNIVARHEELQFTAVAWPDYPDIVSKYIWTFNSPREGTPSRRFPVGLGGKKTFVSEASSIPHTFLVHGRCTASVTAYNDISNATSKTVDIHVIDYIERLEIVVLSDKTKRRTNSTLKFRHHVYKGTNMSLTWSFGDGSDEIVTNKLETVEHIFTRPGAYNITLQARNPISSANVSKILFILDQSYCVEPKVSIINQPRLQVHYSQPFTLEADVETDCNLTSSMAYHWSIDGHKIGYANEMNKKVLVLPPTSLDYGIHTIMFKAEMVDTIVYGVDMTTIEIIHSPLVGMIRGGIFRMVAEKDLVEIDGTSSFDPDNAASQNFSFIWQCYYSTEDGNYGNNCFHDNTTHNASCQVAMDTAVLFFHGDCLVTASNYTFNLTVYAPGRDNGSSFQTLALARDQENVLDITIVRPYSIMDPVNADRKLSFYVECSNCASTYLKYAWYLKHVADYNLNNLARAHDVPCVEANGWTYYALTVRKDEEESGDKGELLPENMDGQTERENSNDKNGDGSHDNTIDLGDYGLVTSDDSEDVEQTTLPFPFGRIEEDIDGVGNRRRRSATTDGVPIIEDLIGVKEDKTSTSSNRGQNTFREISVAGENKDSSKSRGSRFYGKNIPVVEGQPGEHGSTGGRKYGNIFTTPVEVHGSDRNIILDSATSSGIGSQSDYLDKLEGNQKDRNRKFTILDKPMINQFLRDEETKTGLHSESLVIRPGVLRQGLTYFVLVKVTDEESGIEGEAVSSFVVNESPVYGTCSILPDSGVELDTEFRVHCKGWRDQHVPLMYELTYNFEESEPQMLIYRGVNSGLNFRLPAGREQHDYTVNVNVDIFDALLAKTSVCRIKVKVTPSAKVDAAVKTRTDGRAWHGQFYTQAKEIYYEITSPERALHKLLDKGDDAVSKVYIGYLATRLNSLNDTEQTTEDADAKNNYSMASLAINETKSPKQQTTNGFDNNAAYIAENNNFNTSYVFEEWKSGQKAGLKLMVDSRTKLLTILETLPIRDEAEILQSAQTLALLTADPGQLSLIGLDVSLKLLRYITNGANAVYRNGLLPTGNLVQLVASTTSSIIATTTRNDAVQDETLASVYRKMTQECIGIADEIVQTELKYHVTSEEPIMTSSEHFSILAARHSTTSQPNRTLTINNAQFTLPSNLESIVKSSSYLRNDFRENSSTENSSTDFEWEEQLKSSRRSYAVDSANGNCYQSHMTSFKMNPYTLQDKNQIETSVSGLSLYNCDGAPIKVAGLQSEERIHIELPNIPKQVPQVTLKKWEMNVHQFNVTLTHLQHALHLVLELVPETQGRLFQLTLLISFTKPPSPQFYKYKYDLDIDQNLLDLFLPAGSFNETGTYYIGIVDSAYNAGRLRPGEVTIRNYTLKLWWGQCLYWHTAKEAWLSDGCSIDKLSTFEVTKCTCDHLTSFGGKFEIIPNELSFLDIEGFFSPNKNPVTLTLVGIVLLLYCVLLFFCYHADLHDNMKGGIVYLLDNAPMDQQKYEITVETGLWRGAGTTSKISIILHGEEGMSETRELISEDDRPMFERNSRDKFILTLPDSIGRIWKVQIWHNNFGPSPSWYVSRVIVRDLNTGTQYMFLCEKWLAVEDQDGKVEREFMALEGTLDFNKAYRTKAVEYLADFHIWASLIMCPPYSGFMRSERLTVCLTMFMTYMCLNAMWYKTSINEYRGEFGLLDLSWRNVTVGAICCAVVIPVGRFLEFLFRRSKPKHASNSHTKDEVNDWEPNYPSGKPNEQESEDSSEQVQPVMTYSLLDQSILNWPNIQTWAQKQWIKRQQSVRSNHDTHSGSSSERLGNGHGNVVLNPHVDLAALHRNGVPEVDQASSGFEDCSSLIRPKASVDSTHTTAAPSVNESTRVHKPQSLPDSLRISTKPQSESDSVKTSKAPSISSTGSNKSCVLADRQKRMLCSHVYLPYWCRYIAWILCGMICVACATVTVMYGYRFGVTKSALWLQSLYFSFMICVLISNPLMILIAVIYAALLYRSNPTHVDSHGYDIFNREKAKDDLRRWKKQLETWDEGEALERGVAARQRSRYLRFARPPQEKQLIEARKRVIKEKKALTLFWECVTFTLTVGLLLIMAYGKNTVPSYRLNTAIGNMFRQSDGLSLDNVETREQWFEWVETSLLKSVYTLPRLQYATNKRQDSSIFNTYLIGQVILRQQRVEETDCPDILPYHDRCLGNSVTMDTRSYSAKIPGMSFTQGEAGNIMLGQLGVYDGSGFVLTLNNLRSEAKSQLEKLEGVNWFDRQTRAIFVELTLYNVPSNLFTAVRLMWEVSPAGDIFPFIQVSSTQLFRYVTLWDDILLACELLFFVLMMLAVKNEALKIIHQRKLYFYNLWNVLNLVSGVMAVFYCACFVYRFAIMADLVERLRSNYYEKHVNMFFIAFWDEMLRSAVGVLLFLTMVNWLRVLRFNQQIAKLGEVYRKARREVVLFFAVFCVTMAAYSSLGHLLFGSVSLTFHNLWSSMLGVTAFLSGRNVRSRSLDEGQGRMIAANVYMFMACVFGFGMLTSYMIAVLSHYFKTRKKRRLLSMGIQDTLVFYWEQFQLRTGLKRPEIEEEPVVILPPEFTMAEIEYQVDELLFRMNALTGSHGLPEKPTFYLTDSDCTYGAGDDGISSGGSETGQVFIDDRLEQRVQKIEDNLCSQEPFLAQLLKLDSLGAEDLTQEKEKQLRSHLEMEIFRQLQIQRQDLQSSPPASESNNKEDNSPLSDDKDGKTDNNNRKLKTPHSPGQNSSSSEETADVGSNVKSSKPRRTQSCLTVKTLQDLLSKPNHEVSDILNDNTGSNPDSPRDKLTFSRTLKQTTNISKPLPNKRNNSSSSSEKISDSSNSNEPETIKKPTKPTFLHSRESSLSDGPKGSPIMKLRTLGAEKGPKTEGHVVLPESSSGSEQDGQQGGKKLLGKSRSLRKTKSRGKGKGPDSLEPGLVLDEIEGEEVESYKGEINLTGLEIIEGSELQSVKMGDNGQHTDESGQVVAREHVITADVHVHHTAN